MTIKVWKVLPGGERRLVSVRVVGGVRDQQPSAEGSLSQWPDCTCPTCKRNAAEAADAL
ncbi:hypothetical protein [Actinacidiphila glaucinigra]|uniref:hypothetical protein n=1 Tax=Actinacidiphila glaucinigra TaxID=235986 RepID=UPI0035E006B5